MGTMRLNPSLPPYRRRTSLIRPMSRGPGGSASPTRVIVVDDDPGILEGLEQRLQHTQDWELSFFSCAMEALEALHNEPGAVVVTDWHMPGLSGLALCEQIKSWDREDGSSYYVIMMTGRRDTDSVVSALDRGADDYISKPFDLRELVARIRAGARMQSLEAQLRSANEQLRYFATTDALTKLPNRRQANASLARELDRTERGLQTLGVLLADIDHFKRINDRWGHQAGDEVLVAVADRLRRSARSYDLVSRWGGEEFLIVCPGVTPDELRAVGERLRCTVGSESIRAGAGDVSVTLSIGCAHTRPGRLVSAAALVALADEALYLAKSSGRNLVC